VLATYFGLRLLLARGGGGRFGASCSVSGKNERRAELLGYAHGLQRLATSAIGGARPWRGVGGALSPMVARKFFVKPEPIFLQLAAVRRK